MNIKTRIRALENKKHDRQGLPVLKVHQEPANPELYFKMPDYSGPRLTRKQWAERYPGHEVQCINLSAADREKVLTRRRKVKPILDILKLKAPDWWEVNNG